MGKAEAEGGEAHEQGRELGGGAVVDLLGGEVDEVLAEVAELVDQAKRVLVRRHLVGQKVGHGEERLHLGPHARAHKVGEGGEGRVGVGSNVRLEALSVALEGGPEQGGSVSEEESG